MSTYAKVYLLDAPYAIDIPYTYFVPRELEDAVFPGRFVTVPFGAGNKRSRGVVDALTEQAPDCTPKPLLSAADDRFSLDEESLSLCRFLKEYTLCTFGDALHAVMPAGAFAHLRERYRLASHVPPGARLREECRELLNFIGQAGDADPDDIRQRFGEKIRALLPKLEKDGFLFADHEIVGQTNNRFRETLTLTVSEEEYRRLSGEDGEKPSIRGEKQLCLLREVHSVPGGEKKALLAAAGASVATLNALIEKGLIALTRTEEYRDPYADIPADLPPNILNESQDAALSELAALYRSGKAKAALLYGVTGSGKTRVIKAMIDEVLGSGRRVIMLVPEISLTPQTVGIFCAYYSGRVAVIHSGLDEGERFDAWKRIRRGEVDLVIGTRSAVLAPLANVGMIVIDEEQEHTYKSDSAPRYHARDVARFRCGQNNALMLLASATPSVESYYRAQNGAYRLVSLTERYGGARLPDVHICDMREELRAGNTSPYSRELLEQLQRVGQEGRQAILLLNRRGYNSFITCESCGEVVKCPHCSVSLTFHRARNGGFLMCHYCGYRTEPPKLCPSCQSPHLSYMGVGTQKAESDLSLALPTLSILRMDADTVTGKSAYEVMLGSFRRHEADILLGTQMVAKGHDFPQVTLVGVLSADATLYLGDYRAGERTFSLLTQVIGRAGRGEYPGLALIQTLSPQNAILNLACRQDYDGFYQQEIRFRESYVFPPFCDMAQFSLTGGDEHEVLGAATLLLNTLKELTGKEYREVPYVAFGPFEAPVYKVNETYRMRLVLKCRQGRRARALFAALLIRVGKQTGRRVSVTCDINPGSV